MHLPLQQLLLGRVRRASFLSARLLLPLILGAGLVTSPILKAQTFGNVAMGGGGFVSGLVMSKTQPNLMYARTDVGGAYRWDATTARWIPLIDWASTAETGYMGAEAIALDPHNSNNVYMLVGTSYFNGGRTAILRSTNQGATFAITDVTAQFKAHGNGMGRNSGEKLAVDPNNGTILLCGTRANGLFRSTNSGASWTHLGSLNVTTTPNANGISLVIFDPASGTNGSATQTVIVGASQTGTNLFRSNDGGTTFSAIAGAPTTLMPQRAFLASDRNLVITYANGAGPFGTTAEPMNTGAIWKYNVQTGAWTDVTPAGNILPFSGITVDPKNANRMVASTINTFRSQGAAFGDQFFITTNGGSSWTNVVARGFGLDANGVTWMTPNQSIHWAGCIEFDPFNTSRVFVNSGNGTFVTENIDAVPTVWKFNVRGLEETVSNDLVSAVGSPVISVIGDFDGFVNKDITQYGPQHTPRMGSTQGLAIAALNPNKVVRAGSSFFFSNNMGSSWTQGTINGSQGHLALSADGATVLHAPSGLSNVFRSTNNGSSWATVTGLAVAGTHPAADQVNSNKFYAYAPSSGAFFVSTNGGVSFAQTTSLPTGGSSHIRTAPGFEGHVWAALFGSGLRRSTNSGTSFSTVSTVTACSAVGLGKAAAGASYPTVYIWGTVGGVEGVHRSTDQGATWTRINDDAHEWGGPGNGQYVIGDANVFGRVYMATVGRGVVYIDSAGGVSLPVAVTGVSVSPTTLSLASGSTGQLTATIAPSTATNQAVTWSTSSASVATVNSNGLVTGVAAGTATITVKTVDGGFTSSSAITVTSINIPVTGVTVSPATASVAVGSTTNLSALVAPANATNKTVTWSSSAPANATVSSAGVVTGVAAGGATITARTQDGGFTSSSAITVTSSNIPATGVSVSPNVVSVAAGNTTTLTAVVTPANATNKTVTWSSSAPAVATVSSAGVVTGIAAGSATITVTAQGGFTATSVVTVTGGAGGPTCTGGTVVTLPFAQNGAGDLCFIVSGNVAFINSWNMQLVEVNGVNFTNKWANSLPARINGNYYIHYVANVPWAHFEINGQ